MRKKVVRSGESRGKNKSRWHESRLSNGEVYLFHIKEHLEPDRSQWFDGLVITYRKDGTTDMSGPILDQAALHGILAKISQLGLTILSVVRLQEDV